MKKWIVALILGLSISSGFAFRGIAPDSGRVVGPVVQVYAQIDTVALKAYVFMPSGSQRDAQRPAIVIFHGGGWTMGEPAWAFSRAEHFARQGMVAVAAQCRLSNQSTIRKMTIGPSAYSAREPTLRPFHLIQAEVFQKIDEFLAARGFIK